ncbi:twin-arginine translocation signal domain-containing protein, partial [Mesorhizobium sp. M00.F.Ca.ET.149.01.1.1]
MGKSRIEAAAISRRRALGMAAQAAAAAGVGLTLPQFVMAAPLDELVERARQAGERHVVVAGGTGAYGDLVKRHFYLPFTEATGIEVVPTG